ncbi:MAG: carbonic anhydrase [Rikenellaceae bacterium]
MKTINLTLSLFFLLLSCTTREVTTVRQLESAILKSDELEKLSPDSVLTLLKQGNQNFIKRSTKNRDPQTQLAKSASIGQAPMAVVLSCIDSRVPVETIFDMGIGDLFVARVAGNVVSEDMLASMEYGCKYVGSKVVLVLGHEFCGAVNAACAGLEDGNLTELIDKIHPAVELAQADGGDPFSKEFQSRAVGYNVDVMVANVRNGSQILRELERQGKIQIVGGVFNLDTGLVTLTTI